jgi:hypothetical protein
MMHVRVSASADEILLVWRPPGHDVVGHEVAVQLLLTIAVLGLVARSTDKRPPY